MSSSPTICETAFRRVTRRKKPSSTVASPIGARWVGRVGQQCRELAAHQEGDDDERGRGDERGRDVDERRGLATAGVTTNEPSEQARDDDALGDKDEPRDHAETDVVLVRGEHAGDDAERDTLDGERGDDGPEVSAPEREHAADKHGARGEVERFDVARSAHRRDESGHDGQHGEHEAPGEQLGDAKEPKLGRAHLEDEQWRRRSRPLWRRARATAIATCAGSGRGGDAPGDEEVRREREEEPEPHRLTEGDERELRSGVLEHHRLMDHRQLEMRRRIVDRDPPRLGEDHDHEGDEGQQALRACRPARMGECRRDDRRQVRGPAWIESARIATSRAGSASAPIVIARLDPMPPKAVPGIEARRARGRPSP